MLIFRDESRDESRDGAIASAVASKIDLSMFSTFTYYSIAFANSPITQVIDAESSERIFPQTDRAERATKLRLIQQV
jgi:hypothetical protein